MNRPGSIKAFSVLEAVVSMVVSAIIIGIVFVVFSILSERLADFKRQNQYTADLNRLTYSLNKDAFESQAVRVSDSGLVFIFDTAQAVVYRRNAKFLLRSQRQFTDTFLISIRELRLDTLSNRTRTQVFNRISIDADLNKVPVKLKCFKKVYPSQLLKTPTHEF